MERAWKWQPFWKGHPKEVKLQLRSEEGGKMGGRAGFLSATGDRSPMVPREGTLCKYPFTE